MSSLFQYFSIYFLVYVKIRHQLSFFGYWAIILFVPRGLEDRNKGSACEMRVLHFVKCSRILICHSINPGSFYKCTGMNLCLLKLSWKCNKKNLNLYSLWQEASIQVLWMLGHRQEQINKKNVVFSKHKYQRIILKPQDTENKSK